MNSPENPRQAIGILADDLTSAADGAAPFLRGFGAVRVHRGVPGDQTHAVLSIDTGSRAVPKRKPAASWRRPPGAGGARHPVQDHGFDAQGPRPDGTGGGHARQRPAAAGGGAGLCRGGAGDARGIQYVHGVPVDASPYGADPVHPARSARLLDLIDPDLGPACVIPEDASAIQLRAAIATARVLVLDAATQQALDARVAQLWGQGCSCLWAGSPGLARALAAQSAEAPITAAATARRATRVLVVVGSANPASQAQCEALRAGGARLATRADEIADEDTLACLRAPRSPQAEPAAVLAALVAQAGRAMARHRFDGLIATGGDTLAALLEALAIDTLTLTCELAPGFPAGTAVCAGQPLSIAMKAGGFGGPGALRDAAWRLLCR